MKSILLCIFIFLAYSGYGQEIPPQKWYAAAASNISLLPKYGGKKKSEEQLKADRQLFASMDSLGMSYAEASKYYDSKGWEFLRAGIYDRAMSRFNQAWMFDSTNANVYWGFGVIAGMLGETDNSISYLKEVLKYDANNINIRNDLAVSHLRAYGQTNDAQYLQKGITFLEDALALNKTNPATLCNFSLYHYHLENYELAEKYLKECQLHGGKADGDLVKALKKRKKK